LYGFGSNQYGELGQGKDENEPISKLSKIKFFNDKKIVDFVCGNGSSYVLIGLKKKTI
jgi:alpha-tubulin suppressor-like RCC1 family protein